MDSSLLEEKTGESIELLAPLFKVSSGELNKFEIPGIKRELSAKFRQGFGQQNEPISAYNYLENWFYFSLDFPRD